MKATYRDHAGTDLSVVNAARVSFNNVSEWDVSLEPIPDNENWENKPGKLVQRLKEKDVNLIQYLARGMPRKEWYGVLDKISHLGKDSLLGESMSDSMTSHNTLEWLIEDLMLMAQHWVPFTHTMITLHIVAPVPVARQCFKHKVGFTESEESRRYVSETPTLYIPSEFREKAVDIKQGSGNVHPASAEWVKTYKAQCYEAINTYDRMISAGIAPEQARFVLPQGVEVQWIWTGNLASFARYYNQRIDSHAQLESQELAKQIGEIIRPLFPVSWDALVKSRRTA